MPNFDDALDRAQREYYDWDDEPEDDTYDPGEPIGQDDLDAIWNGAPLPVEVP